MLKPDLIRLRHMREAASYAQEMAASRTRSDLDENVMLRMALIHCLRILGEAASKVTHETGCIPVDPVRTNRRDASPTDYACFDVDLDIVRTTVAEDLPPLLTALDAALAVG